MAENSKISWTTHTFNPWTGCAKVSDGCKNCYAEALSKRWGRDIWGVNGARPRTSAANWRKPLKWDADAKAEGVRARVFCASLADVFEGREDLAPALFDLWALIAKTPNLDWLLLTKRPENISKRLPLDWGKGWPNVWLGTSIEDMRVAGRADILRAVPAAVRWISWEPALGPLAEMPLDGLHWIIYGGESGAGFRPDKPEWARTMYEKCRRSGVAFFYKQTAARWPATEPTLDGVKIEEYPTAKESAT